MEKSTFKVTSKIEPLYTGGKVLLSAKGDFLVCACTDEVLVVEFATGKVLKRLEGDTSVITSIALHPDDTHVITCTRNNLIRNWSLADVHCKRVWKGHAGPVVDCDYHPGGTLVATSSTDHTVKVWSPEGGFCTHNFVGHKGVVNLVRFFPSTRSRLLFSADDQCQIRMWNLDLPGESVMLINHMSLITAFGFNIDTNTLYSVGNDKVLNVWDIPTKKLRSTIITYNEERSLAVLDGSGVVLPAEVTAHVAKLKKAGSKTVDLIALGGADGALRLWAVDPVRAAGECVWREQRATESQQPSKTTEQVDSLHWCPSSRLLTCASSSQVISFIDFSQTRDKIKKSKQLAGFLDSVLDVKFLDKQCTQVVAATNSNDLVVFGLESHDTTFMPGHTDVVLTLDVSRDGKWILSGSRDHTVRVWDSKTLECVAVGKGHTDPVAAVAFGKKAKTGNFLVSVSQDRTLKTWNFDGSKLTVAGTTRGHDKDINTVDLSPNDKLIATGSQDRTVKLWNASDLSQVGVLNGHRRGVWHVRFSPVDQCLASASADNTIRLWSINDMTCIKTLEGHAVSVLRVEFLSTGAQLLSTGGDGVLKLWNIKSAECIMTEDSHTDKAWALCVGPEVNPADPNADPTLPKTLRLATGAADSTLCLWEDCSAAVESERKRLEEEQVLVEQRLRNSLANKDYHNALVYALSLGHKGKALEVLDSMLVLRADDAGFSSGQARLTELVKQLDDPQLAKCLLYIRDWNTIGKFSPIAQQFLHSILRVHPLSKLLGILA